MPAEQQLERSVLERKEREELRAIAQAMSLQTTSRSKKADIIDLILRAAGVEVADVPRPSRMALRPGGPRKAAASAASEPAAETGTGVATIGRSSGPSSSNGASAKSAANGSGSEHGSNGDHADVPAGTANGTQAKDPAAVTTSEDSSELQSEASSPASHRGRPDRIPPARSPAGSSGQAGYGRFGEPSFAQAARQGAPRAPAASSSGTRERQGAAERWLRRRSTRASSSRCKACSTCATRDTASCGPTATCRARATYTYRSARPAGSRIRKGDFVEGACRPAASNEKFPALIRIDSVSGLTPDEARNRPKFEDLTPLFPDSKLRLETPGANDNLTARIIDLLSPIGKGQRGLIVSPPKAGKTTIMKQIAHSIEINNPEVHLMVLLVAERPEEVTDMRRSVQGEVIGSNFDRPAEEHTAVTELAIERAKRLVEAGKDVVIVLDGITRLARAYNLAQPATGRIMSGGVDSGALYPPKKFFGAARNIEEGGSLTILATALVETGSRADELIFEEFKGTGNMELRLDRRLAERRLYPSIDVNASSTRHEELLFDRGQLQQVWKLRRVLNALAADGNSAPGLELLMDKIRSDPLERRVPGRDRQGRRPAGLSRPEPRLAGTIEWRRNESRHPPRLRRVSRALLVRQHLHDPLDSRRAPRGALQRVPPVLHRQAEARGLRGPGRALRAPLRSAFVSYEALKRDSHGPARPAPSLPPLFSPGHP